ncbi:TPM domain-containing protein [Nitrosomonas nitrosa]|uniref:TPM domain-containing protein n=1 Tax=Nitrosomonas nitrosa TaxID=52442 RepID=UPI000D31A342|nr:TPM domain-containing protein [Nitrosomonas nitrosa]MCO6433532.1 TPM domain-containing protein [Nitrosomonas nitrosa]
MNFLRILCHLKTGQLAVKRTFSVASLDAIEHAIKQSEACHTGEIIFAVEPSLDLLPLLKGQSARERAIDLFSLLRVWDTPQNNGVLIYLLLADHDVEIVADRGIDAKVGLAGWEAICHEMERTFRKGQFESGALAGINAITHLLQTHFPAESAGGENILSDRPVVLG